MGRRKRYFHSKPWPGCEPGARAIAHGNQIVEVVAFSPYSERPYHVVLRPTSRDDWESLYLKPYEISAYRPRPDRRTLRFSLSGLRIIDPASAVPGVYAEDGRFLECGEPYYALPGDPRPWRTDRPNPKSPRDWPIPQCMGRAVHGPDDDHCTCPRVLKSVARAAGWVPPRRQRVVVIGEDNPC